MGVSLSGRLQVSVMQAFLGGSLGSKRTQTGKNKADKH